MAIFLTFYSFTNPFEASHSPIYSLSWLDMNHFYVCRGLAVILRTPYPMSKNNFLRLFFALFTHFDGLHSPIYARYKKVMNMFFVPTHFTYKMSYFRTSYLHKIFRLWFVTNHYEAYISVMSNPKMRGIVPNDASGSWLQFALPRHHLRWCMAGLAALEVREISKKKVA